MIEYINGEQTNVPCREIPHNLCPYISFFKKMKHNFPFPQHGLCTASGFLKAQYRKE